MTVERRHQTSAQQQPPSFQFPQGEEAKSAFDHFAEKWLQPRIENLLVERLPAVLCDVAVPAESGDCLDVEERGSNVCRT